MFKQNSSYSLTSIELQPFRGSGLTVWLVAGVVEGGVEGGGVEEGGG